MQRVLLYMMLTGQASGAGGFYVLSINKALPLSGAAAGVRWAILSSSGAFPSLPRERKSVIITRKYGANAPLEAYG